MYLAASVPLCPSMGDPTDGIGDRPAGCSDSEARLIDALRDTVAAADPVPLHVTHGLRGAFSLREVPVLSGEEAWGPGMQRVSGAPEPGGRPPGDGPPPRGGERVHPSG
jgi:hypothetical protein